MGRRRARLILAAFAGALLLAPAAAHAQNAGLDGQCRSAGGPESMCLGIEKVGERASAECRRPGVVADSQCPVVAGRTVDRSRIAAYQDSWVHHALATQYELGNDVPLANAPWIGTHNSFNSTSEFPTASHTDSNQQLSLGEQLDIDMRKLEIDVHWEPGRSQLTGEPVVCHARGPDEEHAGCTTERTLRDTLPEIRDWLDAHPDQVLLLYLEDNLDDATAHDAAAKAVSDVLGKRVYQTGSDSCQTLPVASLTRQDVLNAGAQVVVVSGCGTGAAWHQQVFDWNPVERESGSPSGFQANCGPDYTRAQYDSLLIRYYEDSTWLSATVDGGSDPVTTTTAARMARCGVDLIDFDQILPDDPRLASVVWSWDANEPSDPSSCTVQETSGRWASRPCGESHPFACRAADGTWTVAATACPAGTTFADPRTGWENEQLRAAAGGSEVWLPTPPSA